MKKIYCSLCGEEIRPSDDEIERVYNGGVPHFDGTWTKLIFITKFATLFKSLPTRHPSRFLEIDYKDKTVSQDICWTCCWRIYLLMTLLKKRDVNLNAKFDKLLRKAKINSFKTIDQEESVFN